MKIKMLMIVLLAGFFGLSAYASTVPLSGPNGHVNTFELDGTTWLWGSSWGVGALQTITSNAPTYELHPNYNTYADNPGDAYWRDNAGAGPDGNKVLEGITFFERTDTTADLTNAVFNFTVDSGTDLDLVRYSAEAFIQVIDSIGNNVLDTIQPITALGSVAMSLNIAGYTNSTIQAGWRVKGKNANPADAATHGKVIVTLVDLYAVSDDYFAPAPLGFEVAPTAISGTEMTMTALEALDNYAVEYQFSNTVNNTSSDWQSSRTWVDSGPVGGITTSALPIVNADFEAAGADWIFENGGGTAVTTTTNISGNTSALISVDGTLGGNWAVVHQQISLAGTDFSGGDDVSLSADIRALDGLNGGGAALKFESVAAGGGILSAVETPVSVTTNWARYSEDFTIHADAVAVKVVLVTSAGWGGPTPTDSDYLFDNVAVSGEVVTAGGLIPDTEYLYTVRARDLSPVTNVTAWLTPAVAGTSTVFDVTAPAPNPMGFVGPPTALGDTAISMVASNAVDDNYGVEYLFTNVTTGASSGWQTDTSWNISSVDVVNADFEDGDNSGWNFASGGNGAGTHSGSIATNISGNGVAQIHVDGTVDGGWAVADQALTNISAFGLSGGDTVTLSVDVRALTGQNGGGAGVKFESWGGGLKISDTGDIFFSGVTESWLTKSVDYTIDSGADEIRIVLLTVAGYASTPSEPSYYLFDDVRLGRGGDILSPGTEYTFMVKARDTSPAYNETDWSAPASATTTGAAPVTPFDVQIAQIMAGEAIFNWDGVAGITYSVQYSTNLVTGPWMDDPGAMDLLSAGGAMSATSTVDGASIFYRVITD